MKYQVDHQNKTITIYSIKYTLSELKDIMKKEKASGYQIVHILEKTEKKDIRYRPANLVMDG